MASILIAVLSYVGFIVAYNTYGRYLSRRIFGLSKDNVTPAVACNDGKDFVPTPWYIVFGHQFTSIAGTGPVIGPAVAIFWGWLPALLWIIFGSIFMGAVHDFGALVVSLRSRGQSIGEVAGRMISPQTRFLFLTILFFVYMIVLAVFGLVIAFIFSHYPQSVLSVIVAMPLAVLIGLWLHRPNAGVLLPSLVALGILYFTVYIGVEYLPITLGDLPLFAGPDAGFIEGLGSSVVLWTLILLVYCFVASVLPVWVLLQPRDYINALQLYVALTLLFVGLLIARPEIVAPALQTPPADAPPLWPFLFIIISCGAMSGFHCLVSSGTSSKQVKSEPDALFIGYGAMQLESVFAVLVVLTIAAGLGMGVVGADGALLTGLPAWQHHYSGNWADMTLGPTVAAFIEGGSNMIAATGISKEFAIGILAVMLACFAATTLDSTARLLRYIFQEFASHTGVTPLKNKYIATLIPVCTGGFMAMLAGPFGPGSGGMILWPLLGAVNQILTGMAFLVITFYLLRHNRPIWFLIFPTIFMVITSGSALIYQLNMFLETRNWLLLALGVVALIMQIWFLVESLRLIRNVRGIPPEALPPLAKKAE